MKEIFILHFSIQHLLFAPFHQLLYNLIVSRRFKGRGHTPSTPQILVGLLGTVVFLGVVSTGVTRYLPTTQDIFLFMFIAGVAIFIAIGTGIALVERKKALNARAMKLSNIDRMSGIEFENYVAGLLKFQGFKIWLTPASGDFGVDLIASKEGETYAVQVKRFKTKKVNRSAVSDAVAGIVHYKATKSMVVTNSYFTKDAKTMAKTTHTKLVDRDTLGEWIKEYLLVC
ncbi:restriction endonuclease [Candidatus Microgenomates bacterium]|nr:MAG: restriction endonuclease [Candidatus Microgenomates bacterium]